VIGLKSASALAFAAAMVAIAAARGALGAAYLTSLSGASWFAIGLVASLACALVGVGWRFDVASRSALVVVRSAGQPFALVDLPSAPPFGGAARSGTAGPIDDTAAARELPAGAQHALVLVGMLAITLPALGNRGVARVAELPDQIEEPSPSSYCVDRRSAEPAVVAPPPAPEVAPQAGCALVRRAVELGYAKSLGSCAPKPTTAPASATAIEHEACTRRHLDEPYAHYAYRRLAEFFDKLRDSSPADAAARDARDIRSHLDYADDLLADVRHAITGSPHASHHLWVNLPDPHPTTLRDRLTGSVRCSTRFADLAVWPPLRDRSLLVEHVFGQLLFASRFGTTASCNDYTIHWNAPADACAQLAADAHALLARDGALASVRAVLDRRRRQLALIELDRTLGRPLPAPPPPVSAIVSLQCLAIDHAGKPTSTAVTIDGEPVAVRELHIAAVRTDTDGPIDAYLDLAALLAGTDRPPPRAPEALDTSRFALTSLDTLVDTDPFAGARWPLADPSIAAVFPYEHHLHAFIESFRRRYLPQRGRL
jgi:hypothetical protein